MRKSTASNATPKSSTKRARSEEQSSSAPSKRSKRQSMTAKPKSTPTKSQYFEPDTEEDEELESDTTVEAEESGYENEETSAVSSSAEDESAFSEEDDTPKSKSKGKGGSAEANARSSAASTLKKELWRHGVKAGLGPGTQVIIKKPKAREAGSTPYQDHTVHPNTMLFLEDLKANNDRQWLKSKLSYLCRPFSTATLIFPSCSKGSADWASQCMTQTIEPH